MCPISLIFIQLFINPESIVNEIKFKSKFIKSNQIQFQKSVKYFASFWFLILVIIQSDDAALLECTVINEVGEGSSTYSVRVEINNTTTIVAWCLCAVVVAIIIILLVGFFYWRSQQKRKLEKITMAGKDKKKQGPIDAEMNGRVNPAFTSFSPLDVDSVGYGPDMQPYQVDESLLHHFSFNAVEWKSTLFGVML